MTFYWWSHWFWITLLSNVLLSIVYVHSYPSHDIAPDYNSNNNDNKNTKTAVTKLYQTTTKFIRPTATTTTATPPIRRVTEETVGQRKTKLQNIPRTEAAAVDSIEEGEEAGEEETVEKTYKENVAVEEEDNPTDEYGDYEVKRSTDENESNSNKIPAESDTVIGQQDQEAKRQSDETAKQGAASSSLDRRSGDIKASEEQSSHPKRQEKETKDFSEHPNLTNFSKTATTNDNNKTETQATAAASSWIPSQPQIENDSPATVKCLDSAEEQSTHNQQADGGDDNPSGAHKVSFTLENVNKEEEILRAESEHRSRKSKELSAEYNHVSRFINFSTDSKNLLTRSASSTSNEYDSDEGNISSEALAIKRTAYFLDASAISAICFTAFGVCCTVGTLGVVLYRRRFLNKPQVLSEPDSSVYIDDSTIRDNSDEMYSLDNDSFLNSLEAMTIQNYWTDSVKHTKL